MNTTEKVVTGVVVSLIVGVIGYNLFFKEQEEDISEMFTATLYQTGDIYEIFKTNDEKKMGKSLGIYCYMPQDTLDFEYIFKKLESNEELRIPNRATLDGEYALFNLNDKPETIEGTYTYIYKRRAHNLYIIMSYDYNSNDHSKENISSEYLVVKSDDKIDNYYLSLNPMTCEQFDDTRKTEELHAPPSSTLAGVPLKDGNGPFGEFRETNATLLSSNKGISKTHRKTNDLRTNETPGVFGKSNTGYPLQAVDPFEVEGLTWDQLVGTTHGRTRDRHAGSDTILFNTGTTLGGSKKKSYKRRRKSRK